LEVQQDYWCGRGEEKEIMIKEREKEWCQFTAGSHGIQLSVRWVNRKDPEDTLNSEYKYSYQGFVITGLNI
jgi:hypothetical protein